MKRILILSLVIPTGEQIQVLKPLHVTIVYIPEEELNSQNIIRNIIQFPFINLFALHFLLQFNDLQLTTKEDIIIFVNKHW